MNPVKFCKFAALTLVLTFALAGCRKRPTHITDIPGRGVPPITNTVGRGGPLDPGTGSGVRVPGGDNTVATPITRGPGGEIPFPEGVRLDRSNFTPDHNQFQQQTVHFAFDSSVVKAEDLGKIQTVADHLKANARAMVEIEGHCDERGTAEYNRALGERRALSVREVLLDLGIANERVNTISYGEDQPADQGHTEAAWTKNRRGVFVLLNPKQ